MRNLIFALFMLTVTGVAFGQEGEFHLDKNYKISKTGLIDLSCSDAQVFITGSSRSDVHVKIDRTIKTQGWSSASNEFSVTVAEENGSLKIRERQEGTNFSFGSFNEEYTIEIETPEGVSLTVRGDDGDYFIKNVNGKIELSLDDSDVQLTDCKGDKFSFRLDDGDLRMDKARGSLEIQGDDADIEIYRAALTSINTDLDDGDLIIETSLSDNGSYNLDTQDGLIALRVIGGGGEFNIWHSDDGTVLAQGGFKTNYETEEETRLTLPNGSAKVNIHADDARVKLSVN